MKTLIGNIGVDAGICWIGDPCYILHTQDRKPEILGDSWPAFCDKLEALKFDQKAGVSFGFTPEHEGLGVVVHTGYGDGEYPVYADVDEKTGLVRSVTIKFF